MCAIFGIIGSYDLQAAEEAFGRLKHRGVDGSSFIADTSLFLGSHRLAISSYGEVMNQPFGKSGLYVLFNGEIYNYQTLASKLGLGEVCEAEVIRECYKRYGDAFIEHISGMYAIAIYDNGLLKLFRDPVGKKPLYYRHTHGIFSFASEIKALLDREKDEIDDNQILTYLSYQSTIAPDTLYRDIRQLEAGRSLVYEGGSFSTESTFAPLSSPCTIKKEDEARAVVERRVREAVSVRIPSKVPYAALLSGGVDSSLIAAMAAREGELRSYCIGYDGYSKYDERRYAEEAAAFIGSSHHEVVFSKDDFFSTIDTILETMDEPLADPALLPLYHLMGHISKEGIKVVLTGDGSDELFLGYKTYAEYADLEQLSSLQYKNWLKGFLKSHFSLHKEWEWYKRIAEGSLLFRSTAETFTDLQQNRLMKRNVRDNHSLDAIRNYREEFERSGRKAAADWYSFLDLKVLLGELFLKKLDRVSMANGIEARSPFMDRAVVAAAFAIDPDLRMGSRRKHLIKTVAMDYLPMSIIERKKKGFNYPYMEWLQEEDSLKIIEEVQRDTGFFRGEHLDYLLRMGKRGMFRQQLFSLFMLCKWIEKSQSQSAKSGLSKKDKESAYGEKRYSTPMRY